ncbi:MAG: SDR family NAD(P)-dependent oxidoreductase [Pseudomonadota bacterium]
MALALIVGAGEGLSGSLARLFAAEGYSVALAARSPDKLADIVAATGATAHRCDASDPAAVTALFAELPQTPEVVVYNPSFRVRGPIAEVDPEGVKKALEVTAYGAFLVAQKAVQGMLELGHGTVLFTGASAGEKGFALSASFAMGKFALRGLAQSMARELHPKNIHIAYVNIDGGIKSDRYTLPPEAPADPMLDPDETAKAYLGLVRQHRSVWTNELTLRPWVEKF